MMTPAGSIIIKMKFTLVLCNMCFSLVMLSLLLMACLNINDADDDDNNNYQWSHSAVQAASLKRLNAMMRVPNASEKDYSHTQHDDDDDDDCVTLAEMWPAGQLLRDELTIRRNQLIDCNEKITSALANINRRKLLERSDFPKDINNKLPMIIEILEDQFKNQFDKGIKQLTSILNNNNNNVSATNQEPLNGDDDDDDASDYDVGVGVGAEETSQQVLAPVAIDVTEDDYRHIGETMESLKIYKELTEPLRKTKGQAKHFVSFSATNLSDAKLRKLFHMYLLHYYGIHDVNN